MRDKFKDHFSGHAGQYREFRPVYPKELFHYLASLTGQHDFAWDCGTGNGQAAVALAEYYKRVIATDASERQIRHAEKKSGVEYRQERAEQTSIADSTADLITVAQAVHWFDETSFTQEVQRVLKPGGVLAVWTYALHRITPDIDKLIDYLYGVLLEPYWPAERQAIEEGYAKLSMPLHALESPTIVMQTQWDLQQLTGYLNTWSAVKRFIEHQGNNPLEIIGKDLQNHWGDKQDRREIRWPLTLRLWRKTEH